MDTPYSGISFKDGRPYKGEGDLRGGWGDHGGLLGHGGTVLQGDMSLALAAIHYKKTPMVAGIENNTYLCSIVTIKKQ